MFSFFHRTPTINLDCFVSNGYVYENVPIVNAHKTYPDWWLDLPLGSRVFDYNIVGDTSKNFMDEIQINNNMKNCYGFLEFYKRGAVIENWSDIRFKVGPVGFKYFCADSLSPSSHKNEQRGQGFKNYHHIKLLNPWLFKCNQDMKFLFMGAVWNMENYDFVIPPGVLNFKITNVAHINILFPKKSQEFEIPVGQPLVHLIPLSDKKLKITNHLITESEHEKMMNTVCSSFYGWRRKFDLVLRNKEREQRKCPFS